ncbi:uncharacterized protein LOC125814069 [Solanum verrucosum]|uniref:uncharacterized protein LOC125814069 n=1 Tax=Solanum verrucosum TaxID=315347 RepID=UPI0020CFF21A|nr:uncharacterized protein LOC125814069 [Solanum verrucosum]
MGQVVYSADCRATRLEASILDMIQTTLTNVLTSLSATIDALVSRVAVCEPDQRATVEVMALMAAIAALRRDVGQLKSVDMSMSFMTVEIIDVLVEPYMPLPTIGDDVRVEEATDLEFEAETYEEMLRVSEEVSYDGLT